MCNRQRQPLKARPSKRGARHPQWAANACFSVGWPSRAWLKATHRSSSAPSVGQLRPSPLMLLPEHLAQRGAGVLAAHPAPLLQLRDDMVHERLDGAGAVDGRKHEPVATDRIDEGLHLVGDAASRAHKLWQAHALAVALAHLA